MLPDEASGQGPGTPRQRGQKFVTVQGGYGAVFAVMVQILLRSGAIAVQIRCERYIYHQLQILCVALAQYRGTILIEARNLSRYTEFYLRADARIRVQQPLQICLDCKSESKNCDEQLTHIVRVRCRNNFKIVPLEIDLIRKNEIRFFIFSQIVPKDRVLSQDEKELFQSNQQFPGIK